MDEVWAPIEGFPDYAISNYGKLKNLKTDRLLRPHTNSYGTLQVVLRKDGRSHTRYIHRLVAEAFISEYSDEKQVRHRRDKTDNFVNNLKFPYGQRMGLLRKNIPTVRVRRLRIVDTDQVFRTVADCARYLKTDRSNIYKVLRGERDNHLGYKFEYYEEDN